MISRQIHRGLVWFNPSTNRIEPFAASHFSVSADENGLIFTLDQNRVFQDGSHLRCADVRTAIQTFIEAGENAAFQWPRGTHVFCQNDKLILNFPSKVPSKVLEQLAHPALAISKSSGLIGLGPYQLQKTSEKEIRLQKVWGNGVQKLIFKVATADELNENFRDGSVQDILYLGLFQAPHQECELLSGLVPTAFWLNVNANTWAFSKKEIRLALQTLVTKAVDDSGIFKEENRIWSLIPPSVLGFDRARENPKPTRSEAEQAKLRLMKEVKAKGKIEIVLRKSMVQDFDWRNFLNQMDPTGDLFNAVFLENDEYFSRYYAGQIGLSFLGSNVSRNDAFEILDMFRKTDKFNPAGVDNDTVTHLSAESNLANEPTDLIELSRRADKWVIENGYVIPLFSKRFKGCVAHGLQGYVIDPRGPLTIDYSQVHWN